MKNFFTEIKNFFKNFKLTKEKQFEPKTVSMTVEPSKPSRKNAPITQTSKGGHRYRLIKHASNKKAHSPAYSQLIWL